MVARAALDLIRPTNCTMIGFAVIVGIYVSKPPPVSWLTLALGFLTGFFVCAYSMAVNDIYDLEVDKVNRPERPLPSGRLSGSTAYRISILMLVAGIGSAALTLNPAAVGIALLYAFLSWLYNTKAKSTGLPGNIIVASSLAIPFIYGGVVSGGTFSGSLLLMMALTAFFSGVGREIVKAMADVEGDAKRGIKSLARSRGPRTASIVGSGFFLGAVATSWVPLLTGLANRFYTFGVIVPDAIFIYLAAATLIKTDAASSYRVKRIALAGMTVGLLVFIGGAF